MKYSSCIEKHKRINFFVPISSYESKIHLLKIIEKVCVYNNSSFEPSICSKLFQFHIICSLFRFENFVDEEVLWNYFIFMCFSWWDSHFSITDYKLELDSNKIVWYNSLIEYGEKKTAELVFIFFISSQDCFIILL